MQPIRLGTRGSQLALWQAEQVQTALQHCGLASLPMVIRPQGDKDQKTPLDRFPERGVFTKAIDQAVLNGQVDLAVHSLKDLPVTLPDGIHLVAVLPRDHWKDVLITKHPLDINRPHVIATSSSRRKAQWKARFPLSQFVDIRGNMEVRLHKFTNNTWDGLILSKAGLDRIGLLPEGAQDLDWMIPAPGQGVIGICCRTEESDTYRNIKGLNHAETWECIHLERQFMRQMEMACQAPVGAIARIEATRMTFTGCIHTPDGKAIWHRNASCPLSEMDKLLPDLCKEARHHILNNGL